MTAAATAFFVTKWLNWGLFPLWPLVIWTIIIGLLGYESYELKKFQNEAKTESEIAMIN